MISTCLATIYFVSLVIAQVKGGPGHLPAVFVSYLCIIHLLFCKEQISLDKDTSIPQVFLIIAAVLSLAFNLNSRSLTYVLGFIINIIIYNNIFKYISLKHFKIFFIFLFLTIFYPIHNGNQLCSIYGNSNALGMILLCLFYFLLLLWEDKIFIIFVSIILSYILLLTGNRSGIISFAVLIVIYFINKKFNKIYTYLLFLILLSGVIFYLAYCVITANNLLYQMDIKYYNRNFLYASQRDTIIKAAIPEILKKPFGLGFGCIDPSAMKEFGIKVTSPHNAYLKMGLEGGLLFLIAYIFLILQAIRKAEYPVTVAMLIAFSIRVFFDIATPFGYSIISALLIAPYYIERGIKQQRLSNRVRWKFMP